MSFFLFQNTIIPIQVTLLGVHDLPQTIILIQLNLAGCEGFGHASTHKSPLIELKLVLRDFYLV